MEGISLPVSLYNFSKMAQGQSSERPKNAKNRSFLPTKGLLGGSPRNLGSGGLAGVQTCEWSISGPTKSYRLGVGSIESPRGGLSKRSTTFFGVLTPFLSNFGPFGPPNPTFFGDDNGFRA